MPFLREKFEGSFALYIILETIQRGWNIYQRGRLGTTFSSQSQ